MLQELSYKPNGTITYWGNKAGAAEVDFLLEKDGEIFTVEVKASKNLRAKSLYVFCAKYQPRLL